MPDTEMAEAYRESAETLRQLVIDQEHSAPPTSLLAPNALLIQAFGTLADAFDLLAEAYESGDQATADAGWAKSEEAGLYWDEAGRLLGAITIECGL